MIKNKLARIAICTAVILIIIPLAFSLYNTAVTEYYKRQYPLPDEYLDTITKYSEQYSVPPELICGVINTESSFVKDAVSHAGAKGLMQITGPTFEWIQYKLDEELSANEVFDIDTNIRYGTFLLSFLYSEFNNWDTALAAYNAGRNKVKDWLADESVSQDGVLVNIPYKETADYVKKVAKAREYYAKNYFYE